MNYQPTDELISLSKVRPACIQQAMGDYEAACRAADVATDRYVSAANRYGAADAALETMVSLCRERDEAYGWLLALRSDHAAIIARLADCDIEGCTCSDDGVSACPYCCARADLREMDNPLYTPRPGSLDAGEYSQLAGVPALVES